MKIIEQLSDYISEEITDARKYAKLARQYREERPSLAKTFYDLSMQELDHMAALHRQVVEIIGEYQRNHGDPPEKMRAVYDYLHKQQMDRSEEVRFIQQMYRDGQ